MGSNHGVMDGDGRGGSSMMRAGERGFTADHRIERNVKVKVLEDQIGMWMRRSCKERERELMNT